MARIRFQGRSITLDELRRLAAHGVDAIKRDYQDKPSKQSKQTKAAKGARAEDGANPQVIAEQANRHAAVEKMQKQRAYSKQ
jgi:hypothetical protein